MRPETTEALPRVGRRCAGLAVRSALLATSAFLLAPGCSSPNERAPLAKPLVVIGVDGLEWRLALELMGSGQMPELRRLAEDGTFARLSTLEPALSPPIWTSIATGVLPARHGILGFVQPGRRGPGGEPLLFTSRERRVKAIWNIAGDAGARSCVVGYWMTFPVEETGGIQVAQTGAPPGTRNDRTRKGGIEPGKSGQVWPADLEERVFQAARDSAASIPLREHELYGNTAAWPEAMQRVARHSRWSLAADAAYQRIALDLVREPGRCDLLIVYLGLPDVLGHRFWRWTYPSDFAAPPPAEEVAAFGDVLRRAYAEIDAFVGEMRRAAGPAAAVVVASDHGMGAWHPKARLELSRTGRTAEAGEPAGSDSDSGPLLRTGGHSAARDAFFAASGPGLRRHSGSLPDTSASVAQAGSIVDMTPTLLALLGIARGSDMDGHAMTALLDEKFLDAHPLREVPTHTPGDWPSTRRFAEAPDPAGSSERIEQLRGLGYLE